MKKQAKTPKLGMDKLVIGALTLITLLSGTILASTKAKANTDTTVVDEVTVIIPTACSLSGSIASGDQHTATVLPGSYTPNIGKTNIKALCNDFNGFSIYAIGYSNDTEGTTTMIGASTGATIATGTATSGDTSNWAMKLTKVSDPTKTYNPNNLNITTGYDDYHAVPNTWTKVASYATGSSETSSATDQTLGANIETTYAALVSGAQVADTYTGKVKYLLVHPASIESISSTAITGVFQAYPGDSISFADGSTENTVVFRQICEDPNDTSTCTFIVTDGEYKNPIGYKGAWVVPMPNGQGGYTMRQFEIQDGENEWIDGLNQMGATAFLGQTIPIYAYPDKAVVYDGNGATAGDMSQVASRFGDSIREYSSGETVLIAPNFYKSGYGFAGWSTSSSATPTNGATIYGPNATVSDSSFTFDANDNVTMYAVWVQSTGNMQSFSCSSLSDNGITALTDTRDGNVYTVGKLADGNCWMMENLRLDGDVALNSTNTNNPIISSLGTSRDNWCTNNDAACVNQSVINTNSTNIGGVNSSGATLIPYYHANSSATYDDRDQWYGYGNYYNWYAATAGNGTYSTTSGNVTGDICPAGWSLPTGGDGGQFSALNTAVNSGSTSDSTGLRAYPANFVYSGYWNGSSANDRSYGGYYWSRTAYNSYYAYNLSFYGDDVNPGDLVLSKYNGLTARCVQSES